MGVGAMAVLACAITQAGDVQAPGNIWRIVLVLSNIVVIATWLWLSKCVLVLTMRRTREGWRRLRGQEVMTAAERPPDWMHSGKAWGIAAALVAAGALILLIAYVIGGMFVAMAQIAGASLIFGGAVYYTETRVERYAHDESRKL